jgi:hypothetical protein
LNEYSATTDTVSFKPSLAAALKTIDCGPWSKATG